MPRIMAIRRGSTSANSTAAAPRSPRGARATLVLFTVASMGVVLGASRAYRSHAQNRRKRSDCPSRRERGDLFVGRLRAGECVLDRGKHGVDLAAEERHGGDDDAGDEGDHQAVLNGGRAALLVGVADAGREIAESDLDDY